MPADLSASNQVPAPPPAPARAATRWPAWLQPRLTIREAAHDFCAWISPRPLPHHLTSLVLTWVLYYLYFGAFGPELGIAALIIVPLLLLLRFTGRTVREYRHMLSLGVGGIHDLRRFHSFQVRRVNCYLDFEGLSSLLISHAWGICHFPLRLPPLMGARLASALRDRLHRRYLLEWNELPKDLADLPESYQVVERSEDVGLGVLPSRAEGLRLILAAVVLFILAALRLHHYLCGSPGAPPGTIGDLAIFTAMAMATAWLLRRAVEVIWFREPVEQARLEEDQEGLTIQLAGHANLRSILVGVVVGIPAYIALVRGLGLLNQATGLLLVPSAALNWTWLQTPLQWQDLALLGGMLPFLLYVLRMQERRQGLMLSGDRLLMWFAWGRTRDYEVAKIANLRVNEGADWMRARLPSQLVPSFVFDYEERAVLGGKGIEEALASQIVALLQERMRGKAPDLADKGTPA